LSLAAGCANRPKAVRQYKAPPLPPTYPAAQAVPLDASLRASAKQLLLTSLGDKDPIIRVHALEGLQQTVGSEASAQILNALNDPEPIVRFAACVTVGQLGLAPAKPTLLKLADDPDPSVRIGARFALHKLGDTHLSQDLAKMSRDPVKGTRGNVAMVLGLLGEPSADRILVPMLRDPDYTIRIQAAEALWRLHDDRGLQPLISSTVSRYPDDQMIALLALAAPKDSRAEQNFRGALTSDYDQVSLVAARCLGMLGSDEGYGVALKGVRSADPGQRYLAALAFGAIARPDAQNALKILLADTDPDVRIAAATAILQLKPLRVA
jgi:HEAT repeat protein